MRDYLYHHRGRLYKAVCPICKGCGTMIDGSTCYYCQGSGEAD